MKTNDKKKSMNGDAPCIDIKGSEKKLKPCVESLSRQTSGAADCLSQKQLTEYMEILQQARSGITNENIQESLDATGGKLDMAGMAQYLTPDNLAKYCFSHLPKQDPSSIIDPQCGQGALLGKHLYYSTKLGIELDNRIRQISGAILINSNCMKVFEAIDDLHPDIDEFRVECGNANVPFGKRWKNKSGDFVDSTAATWEWLRKRACFGFFIANRSTIEKQEIDKHAWVYRSEFLKAGDYWPNMRETTEIGIVWWENPAWKQSVNPTITWRLEERFEVIKKIVDEESAKRPDFNIYLAGRKLKTYLSFRTQTKLELSDVAINRLHRINDCDPLTLTTEKESRTLMNDLITAGIYTIQPEAKLAILHALEEVIKIACPIMPVTDFETVAYADDEEAIVAMATINKQVKSGWSISLTEGKKYDIITGSYKFTEMFKRMKVHYDETRMETYSVEHDCSLSGSDRYIQLHDDNRNTFRFMDRPRQEAHYGVVELEEGLLWKFFKKPEVKTIAETCAADVEKNIEILKALEMVGGYTYFDGQMSYLSRVAVKDSALLAAQTGAGKSLMAISLLSLKSPHRALIIAPQGTTRSSKPDEDEESEDEFDMTASQWVKEINRFAPYQQVYELFSYDDHERICKANGGQLPAGLYISYYEAMFSNGAREVAPPSWDDIKLNKYAESIGLKPIPKPDGDMLPKRFYCDQIGHERHGIRCILEPCLSTLISEKFDCVILDEGHKIQNGTSTVSQMVIRMQAKYRYILTATPIPNVIDNLFCAMGWLTVPEWYRGGMLNAAFPYAREDEGRFVNTFRSQERDLTQEEENRRKDPKWNGKCIKTSPIISSPARLLKIIKPMMAFISKTDVNINYIPPKITDVRVPMGTEQTKLYGYYLDRANIPATNPLVRARKQTQWLRAICADPAHFKHGSDATPKVGSNMNPKVIAILELCREILERGEQVVIVNSRIGLTDTLIEKLSECGVSMTRIDSTMSAEQHSSQANFFKKRKAMVMMMGIKCASSHSFDQCQNLIIGSLEWAPGHLTQASGRIDRVNNSRVKNIYIILNKNSMEEVMYEANALKDSASEICLRGRRIPKDFKPVDGSELLADAIQRFDLNGGTPERECEKKWPALKELITKAVNKNK